MPNFKVMFRRPSNDVRKNTYFRVTLQAVCDVHKLLFKAETQLLHDGSREKTGSGGNRFWLVL